MTFLHRAFRLLTSGLVSGVPGLALEYLILIYWLLTVPQSKVQLWRYEWSKRSPLLILPWYGALARKSETLFELTVKPENKITNFSGSTSDRGVISSILYLARIIVIFVVVAVIGPTIINIFTISTAVVIRAIMICFYITSFLTITFTISIIIFITFRHL